MSDSLFDTLPKNVQQSIDDAFNTAIDPNNSSGFSSSRPKSNPIPNVPTASSGNDGGGGGFILDDNEGVIGGGFLVEDSNSEPSNNLKNKPGDLIPLDLIPTALQLLDLPPDDDEILAVFRNAASGWSSSSLQMPKPLDPQARYVSRDDWRSVGAVLLENRVSDQDGDEDLDGGDLSEYTQARGNDEDGDVFMSDEYENSESSGDNDNSDDEYHDERHASSRTRGGKASQQHKPQLSLPSRSQTPKKPTSRQYQTCLDAYALFFPDTSTEELPKKRIMISDLQRVSKLLGEKTKAEEMIEMLEIFSTSQDKAMDFNDFTRMMIAAKLA